MPKDETFRPGIHRKNEKLVIFRQSSVTVVRVWDKPAGWVKTSDRPFWRHCRPEIDLAMRVLLQRERRAVDEFRKFEAGCSDKTALLPGCSIPWPVYNLQKLQRLIAIHKEFYEQVPEAVRDAVAAFRTRQFSLLSFCARCPGALDLLHSTPAIGFMLANSWVFGPRVCRPLRAVRALLRGRQRHQLEWLNFAVPSEAAVRIMRKIPAQQCSIPVLLYLRQAMADPEIMRALSHLDRVNRGVVRTVSDPDLMSMVTPTLLAEISVLKSEDDAPNTAYDLKDLLERCPANVARPRIQDRHQLHQRLGRILREEEDIYPTDFKKLDFPPPPIEGTLGIIPLCSLDELQEEGDIQRHCIGGYGRQIARGDSYAYRVVASRERATALISSKWQQGKMIWVLEECRGKANAAVRADTIDLLNGWLAVRQGLDLDEVSLFSGIGRELIVREEPEVVLDTQMSFDDLDEGVF